MNQLHAILLERGFTVLYDRRKFVTAIKALVHNPEAQVRLCIRSSARTGGEWRGALQAAEQVGDDVKEVREA